MKKQITFVFLFLFYYAFGISQINPFGIPFIQNYSLKQYNASSQNWAVVQDQRGILYFANNDGVLEYDGQSWRLINVNQGAIVRSLAIDSSGVVYVGAENEFGFLKPDEIGNLSYISLSDSISDDQKDYFNIQKLFIMPDGVYFCYLKRLFIYLNNNIKIVELPKGGFLSVKAGEEIYMGDYYEGLMKLEGEQFILCKGGVYYAEKDIFSILPHKNGQLIIGTSVDGLFLYNEKDGKSEILNAKTINGFVKDYNLYDAIRQNDKFIFNTLYGGSVTTDSDFVIHELYDKKLGLQDDVILGSYENDDNFIASALWLTLNNGIAKVENNSPFRLFDENYGLQDEIIDITVYNGSLFFATINGIYQLKYNKNQPWISRIIKTEGEYCSLLNYENKLFAGGAYNLFYFNKTETKFDESSDMVYKLYGSEKYKSRIYIGQENGITIHQFTDGKLIKSDTIKGIESRIDEIVEDSEGNLWCSSVNNDLYKVIFSTDSIITKIYNNDSGLPVTNNIKIFKYEDEIYFSVQHDLLVYDMTTEKLRSMTDIEDELKSQFINISRIKKDAFENLWLLSENNRIKYISKNENDQFMTSIIPFNRLPKCVVNTIYPANNGILWIGTSEGLFTFNINEDFSYNEPYKALIRKVVIGEDSVLFHGTFHENGNINLKQPASFVPVLDYKNNGLSFNYASSFYIQESETRYSFKLEGFDKNWSNWSKETKKEYTNLPEGPYYFKVKAKNIYDLESNITEYFFEILPPWYRTIIAYFVFGILAILFIWIIVKLNIRRLEYEKRRLEGIVEERTTEITKQKNKIEKQNREITDSIKYAKQIQRAVLPPKKLISDQLPEHFVLFKPRDIVSGDFYWMKQVNNHTLITAADCTGHGVPGAFMSMLGIALLNEIVRKEEITNASDVLTELRKQVKISMRQTDKKEERKNGRPEQMPVKDGMDIAFCIIDIENMKLHFAGAYNPLYLFRNVKNKTLNEFEGLKITGNDMYNLHEIKGDKMPIGIHLVEKERFTNHEIDLCKGDTIYMFSDGFVDQIGGERNRKFMAKPYKKLLFDIQGKRMNQQKIILNETIENWKGNEEQVDDILILGIRI